MSFGSSSSGNNPFAQAMTDETNFMAQMEQAKMHREATEQQLIAKRHEVSQGVTNALAKLVGMVQI